MTARGVSARVGGAAREEHERSAAIGHVGAGVAGAVGRRVAIDGHRGGAVEGDPGAGLVPGVFLLRRRGPRVFEARLASP